jgi:hypothetical protein
VKDIMAALEAKHGVARVFALVAIFVVICFGATATADPTLQTFDEGRFSVSYPSHWTRAAGDDDVSRGQALLAVHRPSAPDVTRFLQCSIARTVQATTLTQSSLNANVAGWTAANFADPASRRRHISFTNEQVGSIRVVTLVDEFISPESGQPVRNFERHFAIVEGRQMVTYFLWCGISVPADEQDLRDVESFVSSVTFNAGAAQ